MSGKYGLRPAMSTCRQSARVLDKMGNFPLKSKDVRPGRAVLPGLERDSDTGIPSGTDAATNPLSVLDIWHARPSLSPPESACLVCFSSLVL